MPIRKSYNCSKCPAYCCSYERITVTRADLKRLAKHFGLKFLDARRKLTKDGEERGERVLRHRSDEHFGSVCRFLDPETRRCTVYEARPRICRDFPGATSCGYYDFLKFERSAQDDPDWIATTS